METNPWMISLATGEGKDAETIWKELASKLIDQMKKDVNANFCISVDYNNYRIVYAQGTSDLISFAVISAMNIISKFTKIPSDYMRIELRYMGTWSTVNL